MSGIGPDKKTLEEENRNDIQPHRQHIGEGVKQETPDPDRDSQPDTYGDLHRLHLFSFSKSVGEICGDEKRNIRQSIERFFPEARTAAFAVQIKIFEHSLDE